MAIVTIAKRASSPGAHQEWEVVGGRDFFQGDDNQRAAAHDEFAIDLANIVPGLGEVHHQHHHHHRHHHHHHQSAASSLCHGWNNCSGRWTCRSLGPRGNSGRGENKNCWWWLIVKGRERGLSSHFGRGCDKHSSKYPIQAVLKKEAFNLVVSDKISYTREVGSYSNLKRRVGWDAHQIDHSTQTIKNL